MFMTDCSHGHKINMTIRIDNNDIIVISIFSISQIRLCPPRFACTQNPPLVHSFAGFRAVVGTSVYIKNI